LVTYPDSLKCYRPNMCAGEGAWRRRLVIYPDNCTYLSVIGRISVQGEGAWRRLAIYPHYFTYLSVIGRISVRGEGAWRRRLQTRACVRAGTSVGHKLLSSQNGGPWDKTS